jgi:hypothetical protein
MVEGEVGRLLDRFTKEVRLVLPVQAVWAHGSLALGDFQSGRSDLDLIAVTEETVDLPRRGELRDLHRRLARSSVHGPKLHCTYVDQAFLVEVDRRHPTWAQGRFFDRTVTPVTRRELHVGGLCLFGQSPEKVLPSVTEQVLTDFIQADLRDFWYPATGKRMPWRRDVWVDLGPLTLARATVTLQDGRLITKAEALQVLNALGAPPALVDDICRRRYEQPVRASLRWRIQRAGLARDFVRSGIERTLAS